MGAWTIPGSHGAKGPILYWLDRCSIDVCGCECLRALLAALKTLAPTYQGLERVFDECLAARYCPDADLRRRIVEYLGQYWFNDGPDAYFPGQKVTQKYAEAVIKAIELSLNGRHHPVPINAWWIIQPSDKVVTMLNLAEVSRSGMTVSSSVTLLIMTPLPPIKAAPTKTALWGDAEAWVTSEQNGFVVTRQTDKEVK